MPAVLRPLSLAVLSLLTPVAWADVQLPAFFSDHAVLQRDAPAPVWGHADPGETVTVEFAGQKQTATADQDGKWLVRLAAMPASAEPRVLTVSGKNQRTLSDVLVGEVWLASGQSNMGFSLNGAHNAAEAIAASTDPSLRFFNVKTDTAGAPKEDVTGVWKQSTPQNSPGFSAVAYFFARELRSHLGCPVGVLQSAWGGTAAQEWLSPEALRAEPTLARYVQRWDEAQKKSQEVAANPQLLVNYREALKRWNAEVRPGFDAATKAWNAAKAAGQDPGPKPTPATPEPVNPDPMGVPNPSSRPSTPTVIYHAMIAPLAPYAMRGAIWYQGEANGSAGLEYRTLLPALIKDWRRLWGAEFPFFIVQLPGWDHDSRTPEFHDWPWLREAQGLTAQKTPRTGLAVTIDLGDPANVHPTGKLEVGRRLGLLARQSVYGEKVIASGPVFAGVTPEAGALRVRFDQTGGGLVIGQSPWLAPAVEQFPQDRLVGFSIAGADQQWKPAEARIDGDAVLVSSPDVPAPVAVRYGWANSPRCNLYNRAGLPAAPFRSDDWPLPNAAAKVH